MSEERLQKILARAGVASRRKVEELIRDGRVTLNGRLAEIGDKADLERDAVKVDGRRVLPPRGNRYLLLYKPRGVMSTLSDPEGRPTVIDLIPPALRKALVPVGRLDYHTEGMLLLTDDGEFAQQVAHPRYGCVKTYEVKVKGHPGERDLDRLRSGIPIEGRRTAPARIRPRPAVGRHFESDNSWWIVELSEGRSRQIREMFQAIGNPVQKLRRVAIGPVSDPTMGPGDLRELTTREVELLRRKSFPGRERQGGRPNGEAERPGGAAKRPGRRPRAAEKPEPGERRGKETSPGRGRETKRPGGKEGARGAKGPGRGAAEPRPAGRSRSGPGLREPAGRPGGERAGAVRARRSDAGAAPPAGARPRGGGGRGKPGVGRPGSGRPGGSRSGGGRPGGGRPGAGRSQRGRS